MTLQEIKDEIAAEIPYDTSVITDQRLVRQLDLFQKEIFPKVKLNASGSFTTVSGTGTYDLSAQVPSCVPKTIRYITYDGKRLGLVSMQTLLALREDNTLTGEPDCAAIDGNNLELHPAPNGAKTVKVYWWGRPTTLSHTNMNATPDLPEDYHRLYIYEGLRYVARQHKDYAAMNGYELEKKELLAELIADVNRTQYRSRRIAAPAWR